MGGESRRDSQGTDGLRKGGEEYFHHLDFGDGFLCA